MKLSQFRWFIVFMLFLAGAISYLDRAALAIAAPLITKDLNLTPAELGIVFSAFFVGYSLFCFVGGYAADRFGAKRVLVASMGLWSVFCGLTAGVVGMVSLLVVRVVFGAGEGPYATCTNKMISGWFERSRQATAVGYANAGQQFGGAIAGPIVGLLAVAVGWRVAFVIIAALGLLWVLLWALTVTDLPEQNRWIRPDARDAAGSAALAPGRSAASDRLQATADPDASLGTFLRSPAILATAFAFFGYAYILYFFLSWFPSYLTMERHLSIQSMSFVNVIPWACGAVGIALGGLTSDTIFRVTGKAVLSRKIIIVTSLLISAACVALAGRVQTLEWAVALMAITVFFINLTLSAYWGIILDTVPQSRMGSVGGFMHLIANTAGIVAPAVTGFLVQGTGLFASAFLLSGGVALAGALAVLYFVRAPRQPEPAGRATAMAASGH
ncbi:MFS transporter [Chitinasiproducens palmae]|uniref:D-galactonate transporter n=1 Tax=Chitinasiproducens palmae TaxID=1770053 RepID=A0A1H2PRQ1_9BURK|nr:MFS transporter [Chitinasiproducens palmae]SDV48785.1 D-galactonate transporter [Chitinasiproducens palmae]